MSASSSLPVGWINVWIVIGLIGFVLFIAFPIAVNRRAQTEFLRYKACVDKTQTTNCQPSLVWAMNGWELK